MDGCWGVNIVMPSYPVSEHAACMVDSYTRHQNKQTASLLSKQDTWKSHYEKPDFDFITETAGH